MLVPHGFTLGLVIIVGDFPSILRGLGLRPRIQY